MEILLNAIYHWNISHTFQYIPKYSISWVSGHFSLGRGHQNQWPPIPPIASVARPDSGRPGGTSPLIAKGAAQVVRELFRQRFSLKTAMGWLSHVINNHCFFGMWCGQIGICHVYIYIYIIIYIYRKWMKLGGHNLQWWHLSLKELVIDRWMQRISSRLWPFWHAQGPHDLGTRMRTIGGSQHHVGPMWDQSLKRHIFETHTADHPNI
jgi:hypothetical protein